MSFTQNNNPCLRFLELKSSRFEAHGEKVYIIGLEREIPFLGFDNDTGLVTLSDGTKTRIRETVRSNSHICYERMLVNVSSLHDIKNWIGYRASDPLFYERLAANYGVLPNSLKQEINDKVRQLNRIHEELIDSGDLDIFEDLEEKARRVSEVFENKTTKKQNVDPFVVALSIFEHNLQSL